MEQNRSASFPKNQSAGNMMSVLHAAANIMEKSPGSIPHTHFPFYPYVTSATLYSNQHHKPKLSTISPQMAPTSVATPFGINNILSRTVTAEVSEENFYENRSIEDLKFNQTPNSAATMATFENGFGCRSAAVAARAAAIF